MDLFIQDLKSYPPSDILLLGQFYHLDGSYQNLLPKIAEKHLGWLRIGNVDWTEEDEEEEDEAERDQLAHEEAVQQPAVQPVIEEEEDEYGPWSDVRIQREAREEEENEQKIQVEGVTYYTKDHKTQLVLRAKLISELPETIGDIQTLTFVELTANRLRTLPESFKNLSSLTELFLSQNQFRIFPMVICEIPSLTYLNMSSNRLMEIPECISQLSLLQDIRLGGNWLRKLPDSLINLRNLKTLEVGVNELSALPDLPTTLMYLDISNNKFETLPNSFQKLTSLDNLDLSGNPMASLPDLRPMTKLSVLGIAKCKNIKTLPEYLLQLPKLMTIYHDQSGLIASLALLPFRRVLRLKDGWSHNSLMERLNDLANPPKTLNDLSTIEKQSFDAEKCADADSLQGDPLTEFQNFEIAEYTENGIVYCFSVQELTEGNVTRNPYTRQSFPQKFLDEVKEKYKILKQLKRGGWSHHQSEPEMALTPAQKVRDILLRMSRSGYLPDIDRIRNMTVSQQNGWIDLMETYGITIRRPSPQIPVNYLLAILEQLTEEQYPTAIITLDEVLQNPDIVVPNNENEDEEESDEDED